MNNWRCAYKIDRTLLLYVKIDRKKRIFWFTRLIIIPVARFRYSGRSVTKTYVSRPVKETLCFPPRVRRFDRYLWGDLYKQTRQGGEGLLEGNPGGREWRYVHCVSSWNKQDVSLPIYPGDAGHHFSFQKNIPMGIEMNGPPPRARLLPFRGCSWLLPEKQWLAK